jgi:hypothetical protein
LEHIDLSSNIQVPHKNGREMSGQIRRKTSIDAEQFIHQLVPEGSNPGVRAFLPWRFRYTNQLRKK